MPTGVVQVSAWGKLIRFVDQVWHVVFRDASRELLRVIPYCEDRHVPWLQGHGETGRRPVVVHKFSSRTDA